MIEYATDFQPAVDELFASESKTALVTNKNFTWTGACWTATKAATA